MWQSLIVECLSTTVIVRTYVKSTELEILALASKLQFLVNDLLLLFCFVFNSILFLRSSVSSYINIKELNSLIYRSFQLGLKGCDSVIINTRGWMSQIKNKVRATFNG